MSGIWELQNRLDEARALVLEKVFAYGSIPPFRQYDDKRWRAWCDIDEALDRYWGAMSSYVASEV